MLINQNIKSECEEFSQLQKAYINGINITELMFLGRQVMAKFQKQRQHSHIMYSQVFMHNEVRILISIYPKEFR